MNEGQGRSPQDTPKNPSPVEGEKAAAAAPDAANICVVVCPSDVPKIHALPEGTKSVLRIFDDLEDTVADFATRMRVKRIVDPVVSVDDVVEVLHDCVRRVLAYLIDQPAWAECSPPLAILLKWIEKSASKMKVNQLVYLAVEVAAVKAFDPKQEMVWVVAQETFDRNRHINAIFYRIVQRFLGGSDPYTVFDVHQCGGDGVKAMDLGALRSMHAADVEYLLKPPKKAEAAAAKLLEGITKTFDPQSIASDYQYHVGEPCPQAVLSKLAMVHLIATIRRAGPDDKPGAVEQLAQLVADRANLKDLLTVEQWSALGMSTAQLLAMGCENAAVADCCLPKLLQGVKTHLGRLDAGTVAPVKALIDQTGVLEVYDCTRWFTLIAPLELGDLVRFQLLDEIGIDTDRIALVELKFTQRAVAAKRKALETQQESLRVKEALLTKRIIRGSPPRPGKAGGLSKLSLHAEMAWRAEIARQRGGAVSPTCRSEAGPALVGVPVPLPTMSIACDGSPTATAPGAADAPPLPGATI